MTVPDALPGSLRAAFSLLQRFTLPAVPAMWRAWWQAGLLYDAPLELAISAGAPLPLEVEQGVFDATGLKIHNFYGSSECGGIAYDRSAEPRSDASFAGTAMDGVKLDVNAEGCLTVEGRNVGEGYWPRGDDALREGAEQTRVLNPHGRGPRRGRGVVAWRVESYLRGDVVITGVPVVQRLLRQRHLAVLSN